MSSVPERLNDQLEQRLIAKKKNQLNHEQALADELDPEIRELVRIAKQLKAAPELRVNQDFANRLESRLLSQQARSRVRYARKRRRQLFSFSHRPQVAFALAGIFVICLICIGAITLAGYNATPNTPFYALKGWEQQVQYDLAWSPTQHARVSFYATSSQLSDLSKLATPEHETAYKQKLAQLQQQLKTTNNLIKTLPPGSKRTQLQQQLDAQKKQVRSTLYQLLPHLSLSERAVTTQFLSQLGTPVTRISKVTVSPASTSTSKTSAHKQITVTITGQDISNNAQLIINNQPVKISSVNHKQGTYVFTIDWDQTSQTLPSTIGLLNADGTLSQVSQIIVTPTLKTWVNSQSPTATPTPTPTVSPSPTATPGKNSAGTNTTPTPTPTPSPSPTPNFFIPLPTITVPFP
ncbi:MAG TPA: hypothetical protein VL461_05220 [Dictyobacter sp.]|jgi:hypothetical protein|nr:hypothetical protein [Dictyobacter sp.]